MRDALSDVFAALSDVTRRGIYEQLFETAEGRTATQISSRAAISRQAIVKHLQVLVRAGLAVAQRDGREVRYFVTTGGTSDASAWLEQRGSQWDRRIAKLEEKVRTTPNSHAVGD
jgi:DNA-binding transcriptional ArsR family regulator